MTYDPDDLISSWYNAYTMKTSPDFGKVPINYVFDENMSVKWNREKVSEYNENFAKERKRLEDEKMIAVTNALEKIYEYIIGEVPGISKDGAIAIFNEAKNSTDEWKYSLVDAVEHYIEFALTVRH